jgi:mRNA interferase MazF
VRRGELWTAAAGKHYAGKSLPVLVVQDDTTVPCAKLGERIAEVTDIDMLALSRALVVFLGLA